MVCAQQGQVLGMQSHPAGYWTLVRFGSREEAAKAHRQLSSIPCGEVSLCGDLEAQRLVSGGSPRRATATATTGAVGCWWQQLGRRGDAWHVNAVRWCHGCFEYPLVFQECRRPLFLYDNCVVRSTF